MLSDDTRDMCLIVLVMKALIICLATLLLTKALSNGDVAVSILATAMIVYAAHSSIEWLQRLREVL